MNNKTNKKFQNWLTKTTQELVTLCGFGRIIINFHEKKTQEKGTELLGLENTSGNVVFSIHYDKVYKVADINFYPIAVDMFEHGGMKEVFESLSHEVAHIFAFPLYELSRRRVTTENELAEANEHLAEDIAGVIRQLYKLKFPIKGRKQVTKKKTK